MRDGGRAARHPKAGGALLPFDPSYPRARLAQMHALTTQNLENPLLRKQLGLEAHERGVAVLHVDYSGSADGTLEPRDVITAIDGLAIANNGTVQHMGHTRTRYDVVLGHRYIGDRIELQIKRNGVARAVILELRPWMPLVPRSAARPRRG